MGFQISSLQVVDLGCRFVVSPSRRDVHLSQCILYTDWVAEK